MIHRASQLFFSFPLPRTAHHGHRHRHGHHHHLLHHHPLPAICSLRPGNVLYSRSGYSLSAFLSDKMNGSKMKVNFNQVSKLLGDTFLPGQPVFAVTTRVQRTKAKLTGQLVLVSFFPANEAYNSSLVAVSS